MIRRRRGPDDGTVRVTFSVADTGSPVSLVGDHNGWDPSATPMRRRSNGTRSATLTLPSGSRLRFRYLVDGYAFVDEADARLEDNGMGATHSVIEV